MMKTINCFYKYVESIRKYRIQPGLDRIKKVLNLLGNPQLKYKTIHIAGTNGKGSTAIFTSKIFESAGCKTGLYISPEIVKYNDRISINGKNISNIDLVKYGNKTVSTIIKSGSYLTEFEFCTVIMFQYFADEKVEFAILETGLGGRLDATNVTNPVVSIVTSLSFDHKIFLGETLTSIAREKLDIFRNARYKIIGNISKYKSIIATKILKNYKIPDNNVYFYGKDFGINKNKEYEFFFNKKIRIPVNEISNYPEYQKYNFACALQAAYFVFVQNIENMNLYKILKNIVLPFRMQKLKGFSNITVDASHNVEAINQFVKTINLQSADKSKMIVIYSCFKDKDYKNIIKILCKNFDNIFIYNLSHERGAELSAFKSERNIKFFKSYIEIIEYIKKYKEFQYYITGSYQTARDFFLNLKK